MIIIVLGAALLLFVSGVLVWILVRGMSSHTRPTPVPTRGPFGAQVDTIGGGADTWRTDPDQLPQLAHALLAHLARDHRVVVIAPADADLPPVFGGPVFRTADLDPEKAGDLVEDVAHTRGALVVAMAWGDGAEQALEDIRHDLPKGTPLLLVAATGEEDQADAVLCTRTDQGWSLTGPAGQAQVRLTDQGFEPLVQAG